MSNLTKAVLLYQELLKRKGGQPSKQLNALYHKIKTECQIIIYEYPVKVKLLQEEEAGELLLILTPRIKVLVTEFEYRGIAFENFLIRTIYLQTIYYKHKSRRQERKHLYFVCPGDEMDNYMLAEPTFQYMRSHPFTEDPSSFNWTMDTAAAKHIKKLLSHYKAFNNRFKQFVVLNGTHLTAEQIAFLAEYMEIDELELAKLITKAFNLSLEKHNRSLHVQEVRNTHYIESQFLKRELELFESFDTHHSTLEKIKKRCLRAHTLFLERCKEVRNRPNPITHEALAQIFKKPKGTIDSGMSALKKALKEIVDDSD
ncbi:MAG: hypothetical protein GX842_00720 [Spirochaetales bacterium]|jgi:hypothetical protein|nr:hypothetical protein [Spirochaetales bacterium]